MRLLAETFCNTAKIFSFFIFFFIFTVGFANQTLIVEPDASALPLLSAIQQAGSSVDLVMYGFTDQEFVRALIGAKARGKSVRVLLQQHPYKAEDENERVIESLQHADIHLMWPDSNFKLTHQKTFILDHAEAVVMTFNLTYSSFKKERNFALIISDPAMVSEIQRVYDADWQHKSSRVQNANLIWSPDNSREKLLALIRGAKTEIKIYAESLTDYQIIGALAGAARDGVRVEILTSADKNKRDSKQFRYLEKAGVEIRFSQGYLIHAKVMMVDGRTAVIGSINLTRASINENRELAVISRDSAVLQKLNRTFVGDWKQK